MTDGRGIIATYSYDLADRITLIDYSGTTPDIGYAYDTAGNTKTRSETDANVTFGYDAFDHLTSRVSTGVGGTGGSVSYAYDLAGNLESTTDAGGTSSYTYDAANQAVSQMTSTGLKVDYAYNDDGDRIETWFDTNTAHTTFAAHTHNDYDNAGRVSRTWTSRDSANGTRAVDLSYCYSPYVSGQACPTAPAGTDTAKIQWSLDNTTAARSVYTYDAGNRLTKATNFNGHTYDYTYDAAGNRTSVKVDGTTTQSLSFNAVNQISATGYGYDAAGNRTQDKSGKTLAYDAADRMTSATPAAGNPMTYTWAGPDQKELTGRTAATGTPFTYTYGREDRNGSPLLETFTKNGNTYSIDYDPAGTPIVFNLPSNTQHFIALDGQGTAQALLNDDGAESGTYTYTPYGDITDATGVGDAVGSNVFRHQLGFIDGATGGTNWTKHGIRWNDNTTGTWTTQDPLTFLLDPDAGNRYLFANADPINNTDPTGLKSCLAKSVEAGAAGAIAGAVTGAGAIAGGVGVFTGVGIVCETELSINALF